MGADVIDFEAARLARLLRELKAAGQRLLDCSHTGHLPGVSMADAEIARITRQILELRST